MIDFEFQSTSFSHFFGSSPSPSDVVVSPSSTNARSSVLRDIEVAGPFSLWDVDEDEELSAPSPSFISSFFCGPFVPAALGSLISMFSLWDVDEDEELFAPFLSFISSPWGMT